MPLSILQLMQAILYRYDCLTLLILLTEVQSVKYPADGLCHASIAQEEANARVLEKKPQ